MRVVCGCPTPLDSPISSFKYMYKNAITKIKEQGFAVFAVYGTLKQHQHNNRVLGDSEFIGETRIKGFDMFSLGGFPGVIPSNGEITVQLFKVTNPIYAQSVYRLEGYNGVRGHVHNNFYDTVDISTGLDEAPVAEMFIYKGGVKKSMKIEDGVW